MRNSGEYNLEIDTDDLNDNNDITKITLGKQISYKKNAEVTVAYISKENWASFNLEDIINTSPLSNLIINNGGYGIGSPTKYFTSDKFSKIMEFTEDDKIAYLLNVIESTKNSLQTLKQNHQIKKNLLDCSRRTACDKIINDVEDHNILEQAIENNNRFTIEEGKKKKSFDEEVKDLRQLYKILKL